MIELHPFTKADIPTLISWIDSAECLAQWSGSGFSYPLDSVQVEQQLLQHMGLEPAMLVFKAVESAKHETVGHIQLLRIDRTNRSATVGRVLIGPVHLRGKGLGAEMVRSLLRIGFEELKLHRIDLRVFDFNAGAIACYKNVGFKQEGLLRDAYRVGDQYWSVYVMSMLDDEWRARDQQPSA